MSSNTGFSVDDSDFVCGAGRRAYKKNKKASKALITQDHVNHWNSLYEKSKTNKFDVIMKGSNEIRNIQQVSHGKNKYTGPISVLNFTEVSKAFENDSNITLPNVNYAVSGNRNKFTNNNNHNGNSNIRCINGFEISHFRIKMINSVTNQCVQWCKVPDRFQRIFEVGYKNGNHNNNSNNNNNMTTAMTDAELWNETTFEVLSNLSRPGEKSSRLSVGKSSELIYQDIGGVRCVTVGNIENQNGLIEGPMDNFDCHGIGIKDTGLVKNTFHLSMSFCEPVKQCFYVNDQIDWIKVYIYFETTDDTVKDGKIRTTIHCFKLYSSDEGSQQPIFRDNNNNYNNSNNNNNTNEGSSNGMRSFSSNMNSNASNGNYYRDNSLGNSNRSNTNSDSINASLFPPLPMMSFTPMPQPSVAGQNNMVERHNENNQRHKPLPPQSQQAAIVNRHQPQQQFYQPVGMPNGRGRVMTGNITNYMPYPNNANGNNINNDWPYRKMPAMSLLPSQSSPSHSTSHPASVSHITMNSQHSPNYGQNGGYGSGSGSGSPNSNIGNYSPVGYSSDSSNSNNGQGYNCSRGTAYNNHGNYHNSHGNNNNNNNNNNYANNGFKTSPMSTSTSYSQGTQVQSHFQSLSQSPQSFQMQLNDHYPNCATSYNNNNSNNGNSNNNNNNSDNTVQGYNTETSNSHNNSVNSRMGPSLDDNKNTSVSPMSSGIVTESIENENAPALSQEELNPFDLNSDIFGNSIMDNNSIIGIGDSNGMPMDNFSVTSNFYNFNNNNSFDNMTFASNFDVNNNNYSIDNNNRNNNRNSNSNNFSHPNQINIANANPFASN